MCHWLVIAAPGNSVSCAICPLAVRVAAALARERASCTALQGAPFGAAQTCTSQCLNCRNYGWVPAFRLTLVEYGQVVRTLAGGTSDFPAQSTVIIQAGVGSMRVM